MTSLLAASLLALGSVASPARAQPLPAPAPEPAGDPAERTALTRDLTALLSGDPAGEIFAASALYERGPDAAPRWRDPLLRSPATARRLAVVTERMLASPRASGLAKLSAIRLRLAEGHSAGALEGLLDRLADTRPVRCVPGPRDCRPGRVTAAHVPDVWRTLGRLGDVRAVPALVERLALHDRHDRSLNALELAPLHEALEALAGERHRRPEDWQRWLERTRRPDVVEARAWWRARRTAAPPPIRPSLRGPRRPGPCDPASLRCPDHDTDRDGLTDDVDACPTRPEVFDGVRDDDGCPD